MGKKAKVQSSYPDGAYLVTNRNGAKTPVVVKGGLVHIVVPGWSNGSTNSTLEKCIANGCTVEAREV